MLLVTGVGVPIGVEVPRPRRAGAGVGVPRRMEIATLNTGYLNLIKLKLGYKVVKFILEPASELQLEVSRLNEQLPFLATD